YDGAKHTPDVKRRICNGFAGLFPSMRNPLDKSSAAQSLDGAPSDGEPAHPRKHTECWLALGNAKVKTPITTEVLPGPDNGTSHCLLNTRATERTMPQTREVEA